MSRTWRETVSPAYLHQEFGIYKGIWMPQMDRCWMSDDGLQVLSRLLRTKWGKVEHASITRVGEITLNGEADMPWALKMQIKNELFGENRLAIEVFPKARNLIDTSDVYHLWVFDKDFDLPFGLHPTRDEQCPCVKRGYRKDLETMAMNAKDLLIKEY